MTTVATTPTGADRTAGRPPGPPGGLKGFRNLRAVNADAPNYYLEMFRTYGDMVRVPLGFYALNLPFHPDAVSFVLQAGAASFVRGRSYDTFRIFMGTGLLTTDRDEWKGRRQVVNPLFHRKVIEGMSEVMASATTRVLDSWAVRAGNGGVAMDMVPESMHITLDALGRVMFDRDMEPDHPLVGPAMDQAIEAMVFRGDLQQLLPPKTPFGYQKRVAKARADLHGIVGEIVAAHRTGAHAERPDLVSLLLASQEAEDGPGLTDDDVRDEIMTVFMAGHETSGTGIAWTLAELARHPEVQERAQQEIEDVLGGRVPGFEDLASLTYVKQVVDEALRLRPPIWVYPRDASEDVEVGGYLVPKGETLLLAPYVTHRHPEFWENPERFDPERFAPGAMDGMPRFAYFPFGGGQRKCVGWTMALQQSYLSVAMVLQRFHLDVAPGFEENLANVVSLRPMAGLRLTVTPRSR